MIIPDYCTVDYYKFAHWFADHSQQHEGIFEVDLCPPSYTPWEDCKDFFFVKWKEWENKDNEKNSPQDYLGQS
jgi:hypothetical protein